MACNDTIFLLLSISMSFFLFVFYLFWVFGAKLLWASLLWIIGELVGGGSVSVVVDISDRCHTTCDTLSVVCARDDFYKMIRFLNFVSSNSILSSYTRCKRSTLLYSQKNKSDFYTSTNFNRGALKSS